MLDSIIFYSVLSIVFMFIVSLLIYAYGVYVRANKRDVIDWLVTYMGTANIAIVIIIIIYFSIG